MTAIRPGLSPQVPPHPPARPLDPNRAAAQRAFFAAALGQPPAAAPAAPEPAAPSRGAAPAGRTPDPSAASPTRILRPGSLLDIRV